MESKNGRLVVCGIMLIVWAAFGQNIETLKAIIKLQSKADSLEKKLSQQDSLIQAQGDKIAEEAKRASQLDSALVDMSGRLHRQYGLPAIADQGFTIGVGATMVLQGTNAPNGVSAGDERVADASFSTDVTFEKKFTSFGSRAFLHCEAAGGKGLDSKLQLFSSVNFDALGLQTVQISEAWYEQTFVNDKIIGAIGLMDPSAYFDGNKAANDETVQFLSKLFVINPTIEYPSSVPGGFYAPGIMLKADPLEGISITGALFDANQDWERIGDNLFSIGQIAFSPKIMGAQGNFRFYGWYNQMPHVQWNKPVDTNENAYGCGASFDQRFGEILTSFVRFGWRSPDVYSLRDAAGYCNLSWSAGVQIEGKLWRRGQDAVGCAVGQVVPSDEYRKANPGLNAKAETHCELYYRIQCFDKMSISPDVQYILNPFGADALLSAKNVPIIGVRSQVDF